MAQFQKFITVGNGDNARAVPVGEQTPTEPLQLFNLPQENEENPYSGLVTTLGQMYNAVNADIEDELRVKTLIEGFQDSFFDKLAFDELKKHVEHVYLRLVNLQQHIRNLNQAASTKGVSLRHLASTVEALQKQALTVFNYLEKIPQRGSLEGQEASQYQLHILNDLNDMVNKVAELRGHDYNKRHFRSSRGWDHIGKANLNNYIKESQPTLTPPQVQQPSPPQPQVSGMQYGQPIEDEEESQ